VQLQEVAHPDPGSVRRTAAQEAKSHPFYRVRNCHCSIGFAIYSGKAVLKLH